MICIHVRCHANYEAHYIYQVPTKIVSLEQYSRHFFCYNSLSIGYMNYCTKSNGQVVTSLQAGVKFELMRGKDGKQKS